MPNGHQSVSNDTEIARAELGAETIGSRVASPISTNIEIVPGYKPRGLADGLLETAKSILPNSSDAALGAFRSVDLMEVVIGDDDRQAISDVTGSPWRHICALRINTKTNRRFVGTGWLIGPRTVMTAGHCVFMHDEGGWAESIEVIPALNGSDRPYNSFVSTQFRAVDGWTSERTSDFDYAAIILDEAVGNETGWFAFSALGETDLLSTDANISGYPQDRDRASRQYFHARKIVRASQRKIYYEIDTYGGQSGSPIWLLAGNRRVAVGIHTNGSSTSNSGTLINSEVFSNMRLWKH
jgi:V8-like Glu-specific endopeptidase